MGEVPGQFVTPVGRIAPDQGGTGQRGPAHPQHVLGDVVEEERDVERPGLPQRGQQRGPLPLGRDDLVVGPGAVGEGHRHPVVARALSDQIVDGEHCFPLDLWPTVGEDGRCGQLPGTNLEHVAIYQIAVLA
jgi:hypothetical protein